VAQWTWNLRLELGHQLEPTPVRVTEFAPAISPQSEQAPTCPASAVTSPPASGYASPATATRHGKRVASQGKTFLSSLMGRCGVQQGSRFLPMSDEERADGSLRVVYAASIRSCRPCPDATSSANGMATPRQSRSPRERPSPSPRRRACFSPLARLAPERTPTRLYAARARPTHRGEPAASHRSFATHSGSDPFPLAASPRSPLVGRTARSQRSHPNSEPDDDQTVRRPRKLCHCARFGGGLTPS
jgi:hypothetical protein